jgi:hypothetical protein
VSFNKGQVNMGILELAGGQPMGIPVEDLVAGSIASEISAITGAFVYTRSIVPDHGSVYFLVRDGPRKRLAIIGPEPLVGIPTDGITRSLSHEGRNLQLTLLPATRTTAAFLRQRFDWLNPVTFGTRTSAGCGDRLGLATPGHLRAIRDCKRAIAPILAQQSIREMARTNRTPIDVMDDAMWGVFQEGWHTGFGADADHLKTTEDIDRCVAAGFTFYTFDPGAYVNNTFTAVAFDGLPWGDLETTSADALARYSTRFDEETVRRAFVKYGKAIAHVATLYRYLKSQMNGRPFEVEVSVDETEQPTTHAEHYIIAGELRRLAVEWISLAPRFVGRFEKGVDYIGDLQVFDRDCAGHAQIAREWGPYKLSIHSGSDKFSIYTIVAHHAGQYVHLKTAGTSYLEALRTVARTNDALFRDVYALAGDRYAEDRASYHVSADPVKAPDAKLSGISDLQTVLDQFDARQMLHVCFGSILARYGADIKATLMQNEEMYYADLQRHFTHHLESFCN